MSDTIRSAAGASRCFWLCRVSNRCWDSSLAGLVSDDHAQLAELLHAILFYYVLLGLVTLHVLAIGAYAWRGKNLFWPMLSGRARLPRDIVAPLRATVAHTAIGLFLAASVFASLWWWGG